MLAIVLPVALVILDGWASWLVLRDAGCTRSERALQLVFVWLLPVVGALVTIHIKRGQVPPGQWAWREPHDCPEDFALPGRNPASAADD